MQATLKQVRLLQCASLFCAGDVVGYGPNPNECCQLLMEVGARYVQGNHDVAVAQDLLLPIMCMNKIAIDSLTWTRTALTPCNRLWLNNLLTSIVDDRFGFTVRHSSLHETDAYMDNRADACRTLRILMHHACFLGHTHRPGVFRYDPSTDDVEPISIQTIQLEKNFRYIIKLASIGQSRDGDPRASFVTFDTDTKTITLHRVSNPIDQTQMRIRQRKLPEVLGVSAGTWRVKPIPELRLDIKHACKQNTSCSSRTSTLRLQTQ